MAIDSKTIGLALSGGGFRATLFGLGSVWRLNEAGLLGKLDRITSVSGGSILAGVLAHRWFDLKFQSGHAKNFEQVIVQPIREFCSQTIPIDISTAIIGHLVPFKTSGDFLADRYRKDLKFGETTLHYLPDPSEEGNPKFIFYATNLQTGRSLRFCRDYVADYYLGMSRKTSSEVTLAKAVAASSAFPPIFSPVVIESDPASWENPHKPLSNLEKLRRRIVLADGGVYDNMGLQTLLKKVDIILVSDAGKPFEIDESPFEDDLLQLNRVSDILIDQCRGLRQEWLVTDFIEGRKHGGYWGIDTDIDKYNDSKALIKHNDITKGLASIPTRLNKFEKEEQGRLINWGYALADVALRTRAKLPIEAPKGWPVPDVAMS
jgi:NTE family protein